MSDSVWVKDTGPRLLAALPCEDVAASAGMGDQRASFQRVFYDVYVTHFPAAFDRLNVATVWTGGDGEHVVGVRLSDPGGDIVGEIQATYQGQPEPSTTVQIFHLGNPVLTLPKPGPYAVDILVEDVPVHTFPLYVLEPVLRPSRAVPRGGVEGPNRKEDADETR